MALLFFSTSSYGQAYETLIEKGEARLEKREYDKAFVYFTAAIALKPDFPTAYGLRGLTYSHMGQFDKGIADLDRAIEIFPGDFWQHSIRGLAFLYSDQSDKAISDFTKAIKIDPDRAAKTNLYLDRGKAYFEAHHLDQAISDFTTYTKSDPNHAAKAAPYLHRGRAYAMKGLYGKAISDLNIAIEKNPQDHKAYSIRGVAYKFQDQYEKAISDFDKAIELNPKAAGKDHIYFERGDAYATTGQFDSALSDLTKALEIDPGSAVAFNLKAWILATCPDAAYRNGVKAVTLAKKAAELDRNGWILDTLAAAYAEAGKFEEAIVTQREVIGILRKEGENETSIGEAVDRLESYEARKPWRE